MTIRDIKMLAAKVALVFVPSVAFSPAIAGAYTPIPEPGMLPLFGLGAVVMIAVAIRKHRNRK